MAAVLLQLADAVVAALDGASLGQSFVIERGYVPVLELKEMGSTLFLHVVPAGLTRQTLTRAPVSQRDYAIDVGIRRRVPEGPKSPAEIAEALDPLVEFAEAVADLFAGKVLAVAAGNAVCVGAETRPVFDPASLDESRLFVSLVVLTFRLVR
jgi:hypothetical protein